MPIACPPDASSCVAWPDNASRLLRFETKMEMESHLSHAAKTAMIRILSSLLVNVNFAISSTKIAMNASMKMRLRARCASL